MSVPDSISPASAKPVRGPPLATRAWPAFVIVLAGIAVRLPLVSAPGFLFDQAQFIWWGYCLNTRGFAEAYRDIDLWGRHHRRCTLPPLNLYGFWASAKLYSLAAGRTMNLDDVHVAADGQRRADATRAYAVFKMPGMLADLATAVLLWLMLRRRTAAGFALAAGLVYAVHPAVIYDSAVWGQVEAIHTLPMLLSLDAAARRRPAQMTAWATLAVLAKTQAILLAPIWITFLLFGCEPTAVAVRVRRIVRSMVVAIVVGAAVVAPFGFDQVRSPASGAAAGIHRAYFEAVGYYPLVHVNGFSAWFLANPMDAPHLGELSRWYIRDDRPWLAGLTARQMGLAALAAVSAAVIFRLYRRRCDDPSLRWAASILVLAFFLLPTQIHERYLPPAIAIWAWAAMPTWRWWIAWVVIGIAALANMVWVWPGPAGGWTADTVGVSIHRDGVGVAAGATCALALLAVFGARFVAGLRCKS